MKNAACLLVGLAALWIVYPDAPAQDGARRGGVQWTQSELERTTEVIKADVEEMRGMRFLRPVAVKLATREEFSRYAREELERSVPAERLAADETIAKMLGVVPVDVDLKETLLTFLEEQVGGFYDPREETFFLMEATPLGVAKIVLAHELTHALDDQHFDLEGGMKQVEEETDRAFAYQALVEGSGTSLMNQWTFAHLDEIDLGGFEAMQKDATASLAAAPAWLSKPLLFAYLRGASFLVRSDLLMEGQMKPAKPEDVRRAFERPPDSTEQILHPEKYWDEERRDAPQPVEIATDGLPSGWRVLRSDTLGELLLGLLSAPPEARALPDFANPMAVLGLQFTHAISEGWGGDRVVLLAKDGARVLQLVTVWDTPRDAAEFFGAMRALAPRLEEAARALGAEGGDGTPGASVEYGAGELEVVVTVHHGVRSRELRRVTKALGRGGPEEER
ncbi:MAG TPA: hypothetical protein VMS76_20240 [Planctomycetota bacterium]|nr:hypothetical protein [Planctomycetota bacterium]